MHPVPEVLLLENILECIAVFVGGTRGLLIIRHLVHVYVHVHLELIFRLVFVRRLSFQRRNYFVSRVRGLWVWVHPVVEIFQIHNASLFVPCGVNYRFFWQIVLAILIDQAIILFRRVVVTAGTFWDLKGFKHARYKLGFGVLELLNIDNGIIIVLIMHGQIDAWFISSCPIDLWQADRWCGILRRIVLTYRRHRLPRLILYPVQWKHTRVGITIVVDYGTSRKLIRILHLLIKCCEHLLLLVL